MTDDVRYWYEEIPQPGAARPQFLPLNPRAAFFEQAFKWLVRSEFAILIIMAVTKTPTAIFLGVAGAMLVLDFGYVWFRKAHTKRGGTVEEQG